MSVIASELKIYNSASNPMNDVDTVGGAINAASEITGGSIGEILGFQAANEEGGVDKTHYKKAFYKNTNADTDLTDSVIWILNGLTAVGANGTVSLVSSAAGDGSSKYVKVIGRDAAGSAQSENITLNGVTPVTGSSTFSTIYRTELRLVADNTLVVAAGDITVTRSTALGIIPTGYYSANSEVDIGLAGTLDDSATTTNSISAPGGIAFTRPNTEGTALAVANGGSLSFGSAQGIWVRQIINDGTLASADIDVVLRIKGTTT